MTRILLILAAAAFGAGPAAAQARYLPQPDTLYYENLNPHRMYIVVRGDTVGDPVRARSIDRLVWRAEGERLVTEVRTDPLSGGEARSEVLEVSARGMVTGIRQGPGDHRARRDLVLPLPEGDLRPGLVWHDTLSDTVRAEGGEYAFQAWRELRVERITDTLGSRIAVVRGTGRMRYRDFYPAASGGHWWLDVSGPMRETFLFDLRNGRLAGREWWMDLRGSAGFPAAGGGTNTVPAGLFSTDTTRIIDARRARALLPEGTAPAPPARAREARGSAAARGGGRIACFRRGTCAPEPRHPPRGQPLETRIVARFAPATGRPHSLLRGAHLGTRVAQIARSSCEGAGRALLYRLDAVLTPHPDARLRAGRTDTDAAA